MKVRVADLEANPFRKIDRYPIDRAKVEMLKAKIGKTMFWDNIIARPNGKGKYQIAYGHHRLIALRELKIKMIDIPIKEISDADMILIMADENHRMMPNPAIMNETILAVKIYLDGELAKYEDLKYADKNIRVLFDGKKGDFKKVKKHGVGRETILKFLGSEWKPSIIQIALGILKTPGEVLDRKAVEKMPSIRKAERFTHAVKKYQVPVEDQTRLADDIVAKDTSAEMIGSYVRKSLPERKKPGIDPAVQRLEKLVDDIDRQAMALHNKIKILRREMKQLGIERLRGARVWLSCNSLKSLFRELQRLKGKDSI